MGWIIHLFFPPAKEAAWVMVKFVLWIISGFFLLVMFIAPESRIDFPVNIVFDHRQGALLMEDQPKIGPWAYIPYRKIEAFDIHERRSSNKDGNETITYYLFTGLKNGSRIFLESSNNREELQTRMDQLVKEVDLTLPFKPENKSSLSPKLFREDAPPKTVLSWTNKIGDRPLRLLFYSLVLTGLPTFIAISAYQDGKNEMGFAMAFFITLFLMIPGWFLVKAISNLVKDFKTRYALTITNEDLEFYEFALQTGIMQHQLRFPWTEMKAVRYSFSPLYNYTDDIEIDFHSDKEPFVLRLNALNPVERMQLAIWLDDHLRQEAPPQ